MAGNNNQPLDRTIGYTVREITTPIDDMYLWTDDSNHQQDTLQKAKADNITYLPVKQDGQITGLVRRDNLSIGETIPLTADWLVTSDTPILHLIELFAETPDRVFLVLQSSKIIGLVAPADLNKIPARASIYLLTAQFEAHLDNLVRSELHENEAELEKLLAENRLKKLRDEHSKTQKGDVSLSLFYHLYLEDLVTIVAKHQGLKKRLGFRSRNHVENELDFSDIRNRVSHLTGLLLTSRTELKDLNSICDKIIQLSEHMRTSDKS